ncbi:hypothetical protein [Amycolatopsis samaneae]|uniref:WXG100 family type VII secretion target n=1 Tax=Amycolatopsis samaneae TaxID=664691 RepID=A0ABW5GRP3_9PSEU
MSYPYNQQYVRGGEPFGGAYGGAYSGGGSGGGYPGGGYPLGETKIDPDWANRISAELQAAVEDISAFTDLLDYNPNPGTFEVAKWLGDRLTDRQNGTSQFGQNLQAVANDIAEGLAKVSMDLQGADKDAAGKIKAQQNAMDDVNSMGENIADDMGGGSSGAPGDGMGGPGGGAGGNGYGMGGSSGGGYGSGYGMGGNGGYGYGMGGSGAYDALGGGVYGYGSGGQPGGGSQGGQGYSSSGAGAPYSQNSSPMVPMRRVLSSPLQSTEMSKPAEPWVAARVDRMEPAEPLTGADWREPAGSLMEPDRWERAEPLTEPDRWEPAKSFTEPDRWEPAEPLSRADRWESADFRPSVQSADVTGRPEPYTEQVRYQPEAPSKDEQKLR